MELFDANAAATNAGAGILDANRDRGRHSRQHGDDLVGLHSQHLDADRQRSGHRPPSNSYISGADAAIKEMTTAATSLGAVKTRIGLQQDFVEGLMDAIDRGVGTLVDADMNEESTRLQALQVQQQLGIQALSIANATSQNILSLFQ